MLADRGFAPTPRLLGIWWIIGGIAVGSLVFVNGHAFNFTVVAIAGFCVIGAQHVLNNFTANSYETGFRASGVGMELGVGRVGGILGPLRDRSVAAGDGRAGCGVLGDRRALRSSRLW